jgi:hypothetical protein
MRTNFLKRLFSVVALFIAGCAAEEAHWDAAKLRQHAVNYYTDQIMDNLIRARNGQFFLHVDINNLQAQVISEVSGTVQGGQTLNNTNSQQTTNQTLTTDTRSISSGLSHAVAGTLGVVGTATNLAVRPFTFSVTPRRNDQLNFGSVPATNDPPIYMAYLKFLNAKPNQPLGKVCEYKLIFGNQVESVRKKQPGETLLEGAPGDKDSAVAGGHTHYYVPGTLKKWKNGEIYYVPIACSEAYFELCLELAGRITIGAKPSKLKELSPNFYELPPKKESPEQEELKRIEQKINSLPQF